MLIGGQLRALLLLVLLQVVHLRSETAGVKRPMGGMPIGPVLLPWKAERLSS